MKKALWSLVPLALFAAGCGSPDQGTTELASSSPELGEARESVPIEYSDEAIEVGFNAQYVLDFLNALNCERVRMELTDHESQGIFSPDEDGDDSEYRYVVMPMRL